MGLANTIMSGVDRFMGLLGYMRATAEVRQVSPTVRAATYRLNEKMYDNTAYEPVLAGGMAEYILKQYFGIDKHVPGFAGYFNPVKEVVDAYQNVLPGQWGQELRPVALKQGDPLDPALEEALARVWRDSNLATEKQTLMKWAANLGTVGLRAVSYREAGRVAVRTDHPGRIFDVEEDAEGNVTGVVLKYRIPKNIGTQIEPIYQQVDVVEVITDEEQSRLVDGIEQIPDDDRALSFGFCPYVILRHKDNNTLFGDWAAKGQERLIHRINYRIARHDAAVDQNMFPNWFATAGGRPPTSMDLSGMKLTYVQGEPNTPPPMLEAIIAKLQHGDIQAFWTELREMMRGPMPELTINDVKLFSHISGDTLDRVLAPAKAAITAVRPNYDHALIRAMQMAVSIGVDLGSLKVGTGSGDDQFHKGGFDFQLADRPSLPMTVGDTLNQAKAETATPMAKAGLAAAYKALGADKKTVLVTAGFSEDEADAMLQRTAQVDVTENNQL